MSRETINVTEAKLNEEVELDWKDDHADTATDFEFELVQDNAVLIIRNTGADDSDGQVTIDAGDYWQKGNEEYVPITIDVDDGETEIVVIESAKYKNSDGKVEVTITEGKDDLPGSSESDNLEFAVIQMPLFGVTRSSD